MTAGHLRPPPEPGTARRVVAVEPVLATALIECRSMASTGTSPVGSDMLLGRLCLARIIHELLSVLQNVQVEKELRLSCPKHRANQPERASVRFARRLQQPWASALRLMNNSG